MIIKGASKTTKKFSVIFACVDPPVPVTVYNTDSKDRAVKLWREIAMAEKDATLKSGTVGGEWYLSLYEHTPESKIKVLTTEDESFGGKYVYSIVYEESDVIQSFDYGMAAKFWLPQ